MDVARLNGSHADLDWHARAVSLIREAAPSVPILIDIPGRKVRTARLAQEPTFAAGDTIILTTDLSHDGTAKVPVTYASLHLDLRAGNTILADDGQLSFTVTSIEGRDIYCRANVSGTLRSAKGINVPMVTLRTELVTDRDRQMLAFARDMGVDFVGISFVESAAHVALIRDALGAGTPAIIAKIENQGGLDHAEEIVAVADAIMIDRGDLSVETGLVGVVLAQKRILEIARRSACPVIVATEMLHSMIAGPSPTKAEVSDITNAVLDGASALMLSGETAIGAFAREAVSLMRSVVDHAAQFASAPPMSTARSGDIPQAVGVAIGSLCAGAPITKIVAVTLSGFAARMVASQMPKQPIIAVTREPSRARRFNLLPGVTGVAVDVTFTKGSSDHIPRCLKELWRRGLIVDDDLILVVGVVYPKSGNRMNLMEIHRVSDIRDALEWVAPRSA